MSRADRDPRPDGRGGRQDCTEAAHPDHTDGSACPNPDMSALDTIGPIFKEGWDRPHTRDDRWW